MEPPLHGLASVAPDIEHCFDQLVIDDAQARRLLEQCHAAAQVQGQDVVQLQCAAGAVLAIVIEYADFRGLDEWGPRLRTGFVKSGDAVRGIAQARVDAAMAGLPWVTDLDDHEIDIARACAMRLLDVLIESHRDDSLCSADEWMLLAKIAVDFFYQQEDRLSFERLAAAAQEHLHECPVAPLWQARWWLLMHSNFAYNGDVARSQAARERLQSLIDRHDMPRQRFELARFEMIDALKDDDLVQADRLFDELERLRFDVRPGRVPHGLRAQALLLARRGHYKDALQKVDLLLALSADVEAPRRDLGVSIVLRAHCLAALGRYEDASAALDREREHQHGAAAQMLAAIIAMLEAMKAMDHLTDDREQKVAVAMRASAALPYDRYLIHLPVWAGRIAECALDAGVETEFVRATIRQRRLLPHDTTREDWPWRLKVFTLGELRVLRDGEPVHTSGKSQRKPLELLALLAAHGGGPLTIEAVIDQLWPSLDASAPRGSFDMALSRLRKLLEVPDAVRINDGKVCLNSTIVWTDVAAFDQVWDRLAAMALGASRSEAASVQAGALADRALSLYKDRLLGSEDATGVLRSVRERLAIKFARVVVDQGARLEAIDQRRVAVALYERALTRDTLAEPIYRALMRAYLQLGERAEALRTFRRCRQLLTAVLGTEPSAQTLALAGEIADNGC